MLHEILDKLDKVRQHGDRYRSVCPVHDGNNPTALSLKEEDGKVLIHCHACLAKGPEVVRAIGLTDAALFNDAPQRTGVNRSRKTRPERMSISSRYITRK